MSVKTQWFHFRQNNSGGSFRTDYNAGLGENVIIEAIDFTHANARAEFIGMYFDGCEAGIDCDCCGDRWNRVWATEGTDVPKIYDKQVQPSKLEGVHSSFLHPLESHFSFLSLKKGA